MSRKYRAEDEICACKYSQGQVDCTRGERGNNCDRCGWNPDVAKKRVAKTKRNWLLQSVGLIKGENDGTV